MKENKFVFCKFPSQMINFYNAFPSGLKKAVINVISKKDDPFEKLVTCQLVSYQFYPKLERCLYD